MRIVAILVPLALLGAVLWYFAATRALFALAPIQDFAGFGQTTAQCAAAYGHANIVLNSKKYVSPQTRGYVKGGLSLLVGFDEQGRAEQFVISRSELFRTSDLSKQEQKYLLDHFKEGSSWILEQHDNGNGPVWTRADGQAYASYIMSNHYLVLMNQHGMDRQIKTLHPH